MMDKAKKIWKAARINGVFRRIARLSTAGLPKGAHITRYAMYEHLKRFQGTIPDGPTLSITDSQEICKAVGISEASITNTTYPGTDILDLPYEDASFDCVASDQVLEHVRGNPQQAIDETFRVVKPGGYVIHGTCLINPIHYYPEDYWRFTDSALRLMTEKHGEVLEVSGWGNPFVWPYVLMGLRAESIPHATWHPMHWLATYNDPQWPVHTWVVAKKRAA